VISKRVCRHVACSAVGRSYGEQVLGVTWSRCTARPSVPATCEALPSDLILLHVDVQMTGCAAPKPPNDRHHAHKSRRPAFKPAPPPYVHFPPWWYASPASIVCISSNVHSQSTATVHTVPLCPFNVPNRSPFEVNHTFTTGSLPAENNKSPSRLKTIWVRERSWPWRMMGFYFDQLVPLCDRALIGDRLVMRLWG
jgi:hypothetical protein